MKTTKLTILSALLFLGSFSAGAQRTGSSSPGSSNHVSIGASGASTPNGTPANNSIRYDNTTSGGYVMAPSESKFAGLDSTDKVETLSRIYDHGAPKSMLWVFMGMNLSKPESNNNGAIGVKFNTKRGIAIGLRYDVKAPILGIGYWSFGANYSKMNFRAEYPNNHYCEYDAKMIEIPIYYGIRGNMGNECYAGIGVGPLFDIGLSGDYKSNFHDEKVSHDTYGSDYRHKFTCGFGAEVWLNIRRVFIGYNLDLNFGDDDLCEYPNSTYKYTHDKGYINNCIKVGFRIK